MSPESERKLLERREKAWSAVKRNYHLYKRDKLETQKKRGESFEPLSEQLQKLVKLKTERRELHEKKPLKPESTLDDEILPLLAKKEDVEQKK